MLPDMFKLEVIPIGKLRKNPFNPRKTFDPKGKDTIKLENMAENIRKDGLLVPIIARPHEGNYQVAAGERRRMASELADLKEIPVIIRNLDDDQMRRYAVVENIHRLDLTDAETTEALGKIWKDDYQDKTRKQMATDLGMPEMTLNRHITAYQSEISAEISSTDASILSDLEEEDKEAAEELAEARTEGELDQDELPEAAKVVRATPKARRKSVVRKIRQAGVKKKKSKEKARRHTKQAISEIKEEAEAEIEGKEARKELRIILAADERLLNRMADFFARAEKLDITFLEQFQTPTARSQAIKVLETVRNAIDKTIEKAQKASNRWMKEWNERQKELQGQEELPRQ